MTSPSLLSVIGHQVDFSSHYSPHMELIPIIEYYHIPTAHSTNALGWFECYRMLKFGLASLDRHI